jgi:hypothetical protein
MNIIDLMALVAGVAFALPLGATIFDEAWIRAAQVAEPQATLLRIGEYVSKFNIALVLVVLVRHIRSGTMFRPAEWLIITNAMRSVHWRLAFAGGMDLAVQWFGWDQQAGRFRAWYTLGMIGFLAVVAALIALRRSRPLWLWLPLLVMLPLFALWGPAICFSSELDVAWRALWPTVPYTSSARAAYLYLMQSPEHVLVCIPFAATLKDLVRKDRPAWTWVERAGLGAALVTALAGGIAITAAHATNFPLLPQRLTNLSIWAAWWLASLAIAWAAVRCLGASWKSWTEPLSGSL